MKKAKALNTFSKGMVLDLHPLSVPNDTLTGCLNGTLITYNGNENMLQNDMGNGRVETAFLPEGYIPLGTCSFGGIIYIVSYNPLIKKCQIGSFPSPERNITSEEISQSSQVITNDDFVKDGKIKSYQIKKELLGNKLSPGDQFKVYVTNNALSAFTTDNGVISKGTAYTISDWGNDKNKTIVGYNPKYLSIIPIIVGESGNIVELTDLKWTEVAGKGIESKGYYYIGNTSNIDGIKKDLDEYRTLVNTGYNIFKSKIPGKLALLCRLETIDSFSVTWDATVEDINESSGNHKIDKKATIQFSMEQSSKHSNIQLKYAVLEDYITNQGTYPVIKDESDNTKDPTETSTVPFSSSNISQVPLKATKTYTFPFDIQNPPNPPQVPFRAVTELINAAEIKYNSKNLQQTYHYEITPAMEFGLVDYLKESGSINFSLIGSGVTELSEWRYFKDEQSITLVLGLEVYPEKNKKVHMVKIDFYDINSAGINESEPIETITLDRKSSYSGTFMNTLTLKEGRLKSDSLYLAKINIYYGESSKTQEEIVPRQIYRWLYTTGQWNKEYLEETKEDFNELTLDNVVDIYIKNTPKDSIKSTVCDNYYPTLNSITPKETKALTGAQINIVGYVQKENSYEFKNPLKTNYTINLSLESSKYPDTFIPKYDSSKFTTSFELNTAEITFPELQPISDQEFIEKIDIYKDSHKNAYPTFPTLDLGKQLKKVWEEDIKLKDWFDIKSHSGGTQDGSTFIIPNKSQIDLSIFGMIYSPITGQQKQQTLSLDYQVAPIIYNSETLDLYGFNSSLNMENTGQLDWQDHGEGHRAVADWYQNDTFVEGSSEDWGDSDIWVSSWESFYPSIAKIPSLIFGTGVGLGKLTAENGAYGVTTESGRGLGGSYLIWLEGTDGVWQPLAPSTYGWPLITKEQAEKQVLVLLTQLYVALQETYSQDMYLLNNIIYLPNYLETWRCPFTTTFSQSLEEVIEINGKISLKALKEKVVKFFKGDNDSEYLEFIRNISKSGDSITTLQMFEHVFSIDTSYIYKQYAKQREPYNAIYMYNDGTFEVKNLDVSRNTLLFDSGNHHLSKLSGDNRLYSDGTVKIENNKVILVPSGTKSSRKLCKVLIYDKGVCKLNSDTYATLGTQQIHFDLGSSGNGKGVVGLNPKYSILD